MNKRNITLAAAAMAFTIASATTPAGLQGRQAPVGFAAVTSAHPVGVAPQEQPRMVVTCLGKAGQSRADEYVPAEVNLILHEDFSSEMLASGTVGNPDLYTTLEDPNTKSEHPGWYNLYPEAMGDGVTIWGGHNIFPAGGTVCLFNKKSYGIYESNIIMPVIDASAEGYEGIVHLQFKACLDAKSSPQVNLMMEAVEINNWSNNWETMGKGVTEVTNEWMIYDVAFYGGKSSVMLNIYNGFGQSVYIDDIYVYQEGQPCMTPIALPHSDYQGTSFTANWEAAPGAESYLIDVYSQEKTYDSTSGQLTNVETTFLLQDQPVEGTSYTVTNCVDGRKYYYRVRSVKDDYKSLYSKVIEVNELLPTRLHPVTDLVATTDPLRGITTGTYTAEWDPIGGAEVYNYWARYENYATQDGPFIVSDLDFDGVTDPEGFLTGWVKEEPESYCYSQIYYDLPQQAGWRGLNSAPYTDYICVDAWQYCIGGKDAGLLSPELDLSKGNGVVTLNVDLSATLYSEIDETTHKRIEGYPRAAVVIFNYDDEIGNWRQDELYYSQGVDDTWSSHTFTFTTGSKRSEIGIYGVYAPENLYIDNVRLTQNYKAGEMLLDPFHFTRFHADTKLEVTVPQRATGSKLYHSVCGTRAERIDDDPMGGVAFLESPYTPLELVGQSDGEVWTGVEAPTLSAATVQPTGDSSIIISNPQGADIVVSDLSGKLVYRAANAPASVTVELSPATSYIVKVGDRTIKVHM